MTHRRLRGLALVPLAALLCALLVACGGGPGAAGLCEDTPQGEVEPTAFRSTQTRDLGGAVTYVSNSLMTYHVSPPTGLQLFEAAWQAASKAALAKGVPVAELEAPMIDDDRVARLSRSISNLSKYISGGAEETGIIEATISAMAASAQDDHTYYLPARYWNEFKRGNVLGAGISTQKVDDGFIVTSVIIGSPAEKLISPGDLITAVNGLSVLEPPPSTPPASGKPGFINFDVIKHGEASATKVEVPRADTPWIGARMLDGSTAYVRVLDFVNAVTCDQFKEMRKRVDSALDAVTSQNPKAWILDLRDNGGGYIQTGAYVTGRMGLEGTLASLRQQDGREYRLEALGNNAVHGAPLAVLLNGHSASTSEMAAVALQDATKAYIVGTQSAGAVAGSVPFPINGGAVFITTSNVAAGPKSRRIDKTGVTPDKKVELDLDLLRREGRDSQLDAATEYLRQKLGR